MLTGLTVAAAAREMGVRGETARRTFSRLAAKAAAWAVHGELPPARDAGRGAARAEGVQYQGSQAAPSAAPRPGPEPPDGALGKVTDFSRSPRVPAGDGGEER